MSQEESQPSIAISSIFSKDGSSFLRVLDGSAEPVTVPLTQAGPQHRSFILATWVRSYAPRLRHLGLSHLLREEARMAEHLWTHTLVVTSPDDDFSVHAWVCGEPGRLDYVYVPPELRRKGIAQALIAHVCGDAYEYGRQWPFKGGLPGNATQNPYLLGRL